MNTSDRRRGAAGAGGHILRSGSANSNSTTAHHGLGRDRDKDRSAACTTNNITTTSNMPTLPPRAAVTNATPTSPDEQLDGTGLPTERRDKDADSLRKGKDIKDKESGGGGSGSPGSSSVASAKSKQRDAALLREKDDRIASLEQELSVMESEFHRELDKLSQTESETATYWQAKHSNLNQQYLRTDTELRLLRADVSQRDNERDELRSGWEVLRRELKERDEEIRGLRGQIRGLKEFVSTSTRTDGQTSDEVFVDAMTRLGNGLQNWVIVNFRRAKMDLSNADEATLAELKDLVPMLEELVHTSKVHLLQSIVSSILVEMIFNAYYVGLSEDQMSQFRKMEELLLSFNEPVNQWRSSTLALIRREAPQRLSEETATFTERVLARINRLLEAVTGVGASEQRDSALRVLINNSVELARLLVVQKAVLRVYMPSILPHQRVPFEPETMEDIGGEDDDDLATREICCVAFPGIIKRGDESGSHMQFRNVISKARVLCSPEV